MKKRNLDEIISEAVHRALLKEVVGTWEPELNQRAKESANYQTQTLPVLFGWQKPQGKNLNRQQQLLNTFVNLLQSGCLSSNYNQYQRAERKAATMIASTLTQVFGNRVNQLTLVPMPTDNIQTNNQRWQKLMTSICSIAGCQNGFGHYCYPNENQPQPTNTANQQGQWDRGFFSQKNVVLLDIVMSEQAMERTRQELEKLGANVILGLVFAKTKKQ